MHAKSAKQAGLRICRAMELARRHMPTHALVVCLPSVAYFPAAYLPASMPAYLLVLVCLPQIQNSKKKTGVIPPKKFVARLKRDNELFRSYMHQVRLQWQLWQATCMRLAGCEHYRRFYSTFCMLLGLLKSELGLGVTCEAHAC
jgi:hypothetical protein